MNGTHHWIREGDGHFCCRCNIQDPLESAIEEELFDLETGIWKDPNASATIKSILMQCPPSEQDIVRFYEIRRNALLDAV